MANSPSERNAKRACDTPPSSSLHTQLSSDDTLTNASCCILSVDKLMSESMSSSSPLSLPPPSTSPSLSTSSLKSYPLHVYKSTTIDTANNNNNNSQQIFRNPNSIESTAVPSPAGSLEQFDFMATPLSVTDDATSDTTSSSILLESTIK